VAAVRITNRSGQKVHLGAEAGLVRFDVESLEGYVVAKASEPVRGGRVRIWIR
jgi:hypothetical protein